MTDITPVSQATFTNKYWQKVPDYLFAANKTFCLLGLQEIPRAMLDIPLGFIKSESGFSIIALLGLKQGINLYVHASGHWHGKYVPAQFRSYPFALVKNASVEDQLVLCVNESSGLVSDNSANIPFFDSAGEIGSELKGLIPFLQNIYKSNLASNGICDILNQYGLITPWKLKVDIAGVEQKIEGLHCIDEVALNKLSDSDFLHLRKEGALIVAFSQLLSAQNISELTQRANAVAEAQSASDLMTDELNFDSIDSDGNISFDNL